MNDPLVSIILPTRNRAHLIRKAILHILDQTYKNYELFVIDDGSTDNTSEIINNVIEETKDKRIKHIKLLRHQGGAQARNAGIKRANGEFIASQDDDDIWEPKYLEKQVANLLSLPEEYGMSYVTYWRYLSSGKKIKMPPATAGPKEGNIWGGTLLRKNYCPFQAGLIRKKVLDEVGLVNESINSLYDWEMWLRIAKKYKIAHIDEPLFTWMHTENSNSANPKKIWWRIDARKYILAKYEEDIKKFGHYTPHISRLSELLIEAGATTEARKYLFLGIREKPTSITLWAKYLLSFIGRWGFKNLAKMRRGLFKKLKLS